MSALQNEKYPIISKLISGWLILTGGFLFLEVLLSLLGLPIVEAVHYDDGFSVMRSSYAFSSFLVEAPLLIFAGILLYKRTSNSWLIAILALFFMFHEFFFALSYFYNLDILNQLSFDYLGYLIGIVIINIPSIIYLYKLKP